jgi:hypothetical protein
VETNSQPQPPIRRESWGGGGGAEVDLKWVWGEDLWRESWGGRTHPPKTHSWGARENSGAVAVVFYPRGTKSALKTLPGGREGREGCGKSSPKTFF